MRLVDPADLGSLATVEFTPPDVLTPAQGGVLLAEEVRPEHKVAWLIGAAVDGYLDLEGEGRRVTLVRLPPPRRGPHLVAVGELDRWSRAVAASSVAAADPAVTRYPLLGPALLHDTSASVTKPSSGGSGGGGFGGGVGGGGGGSW